MLISVAIATYNRASMAAEAIGAALDQSLAPGEVIVADDASTDSTAQVLEELRAQDGRVRVIRQQSNTGGVRNWNRAMEAATGEFIAWCSDDDRFLPGHLAASVQYLKANPSVGFVHSGFVDSIETAEGTVRQPRTLRSQQATRLTHEDLFTYLLCYYDWPFHPSTIVMRREVWRQVGPFDPRYELADTDWFVRAVSQYPAVLLPRHGVLNRRHAGNWSNRVGSACMQAEIFAIVDRAMLRRWPHASVSRMVWRTLWSLNVRLRLALTIRARLRSGHQAAALAAWDSFTELVGRPLPAWARRAGAAVIRRWPTGQVGEAGQTSVSPL